MRVVACSFQSFDFMICHLLVLGRIPVTTTFDGFFCLTFLEECFAFVVAGFVAGEGVDDRLTPSAISKHEERTRSWFSLADNFGDLS
jgi:hypothetical protein